MNEQSYQQAPPLPTTSQSLVDWTQIIYGLHALSLVIGISAPPRSIGAFLLGWPSIIAVIMNYIKRSEVRGTWLESHFRWQLRTFWFGLLWVVAVHAVRGHHARHRPDHRLAAGSASSRSGSSTAWRADGWRCATASRCTSDRSRGTRASVVHPIQIETGAPVPQADASRVDAAGLERALRASIAGEVRFDRVTRALYSTDASVYQIEPLGVVVARNRDDIIADRPPLPRVPLPADAARRRNVAGRPGRRQRRHPRHVEVRQPAAGGRRRAAHRARRAGHRARRAERAAQAAQPALRARHLHGQPRHARRHDGQQLRRRAVGAVRHHAAPRPRAAGRLRGRNGGAPARSVAV